MVSQKQPRTHPPTNRGETADVQKHMKACLQVLQNLATRVDDVT